MRRKLETAKVAGGLDESSQSVRTQKKTKKEEEQEQEKGEEGEEEGMMMVNVQMWRKSGESSKCRIRYGVPSPELKEGQCPSLSAGRQGFPCTWHAHFQLHPNSSSIINYSYTYRVYNSEIYIKKQNSD